MILRLFFAPALLLCPLTACKADRQEGSEKFDLGEVVSRPDGRRIIIDQILEDRVVVFRKAEKGQADPSDIWKGAGGSLLTEATALCAAGILIVEPGNNEPEFNFSQIILPDAESRFGWPGSNRELANCVAKNSSEDFTIQRHNNGLKFGQLADGEIIRPAKRLNSNSRKP